MVHVVAVDPLEHDRTASSTLPEQPAKFVDLRLRDGLDPNGHFTQQKQVTRAAAGPAVRPRRRRRQPVRGVRQPGRRSTRLYATLSKDPKLAEFAFVLNWPKLKPEEKRALYSKYACHELNFFLCEEGPGVLRRGGQAVPGEQEGQDVPRPLAARRRPERATCDPWEYGRLNTVERVLLAQRIAGEPAKTARHLNDLLRLLPPNADRDAVPVRHRRAGRATLDDRRRARLRTRSKTQADDAERRDAEPASADGGRRRPAAAGEAAAGACGRCRSRPAGSRRQAQPMAGRGEEGRGEDATARTTPATASERRQATEADRSRARPRTVLRATTARRPSSASSTASSTRPWSGPRTTTTTCRIQQQIADLVPVSPFWLDYARHDGKAPFLSRHLADASRNFTEMMFALAVLDLPFEAGKHDVKFDGGKMTLDARPAP